MKNDELGPGYLHAEEFLSDGEWRRYSLTVKAVHQPNTIKSADGKPIDKPIVEFGETEKRLVLNAINQRLLKCAVGSAKPSQWIGRKVTLYAAIGNWFGQKDVAAIRVHVPPGGARPFLTQAHLGKDLTGKIEAK